MYDFQSSGNLMQQLQLINARCEKETQIKWLFDKTKLKCITVSQCLICFETYKIFYL